MKKAKVIDGLIDVKIAGTVIEFPDGTKGKIIDFMMVSNPKISRPKGADSYLILGSCRVGTLNSPLRHNFGGTFGGEKLNAVLYVKLLK